jgi:hypothetical protein
MGATIMPMDSRVPVLVRILFYQTLATQSIHTLVPHRTELATKIDGMIVSSPKKHPTSYILKLAGVTFSRRQSQQVTFNYTQYRKSSVEAAIVPYTRFSAVKQSTYSLYTVTLHLYATG